MRYLVGLLIAAGLLILLIILLLTGGGGSGGSKTPANKPLVDYANTGAQMSLTVDGPINAEQDHTQFVITVDQNNVTYQKIQGYQGHAVDTKQFPNNETAYADFLKALGRAGFTLGDNTKSLQDERGYCPLGNRYIYAINDGGQQIQRYWSTNCGGPKTYQGNAGLTLALFEDQVPGFGDIDTGISD